MLPYDEPIFSGNSNKVVASYGPRCLVGGDTVESTHPSEAAFWGVYRHEEDGTASFVGDALDRESACAFARLVAACSHR